ncbi:MAG: hypothetical protein JO113_00105 [Candidatus Eremiobacteraeota bacterium]|nr:hypothetical protein [Candidatus Eremiobacteraeota bacterium]
MSDEKKIKDEELDKVSGGLNPQPLPPERANPREELNPQPLPPRQDI